MCIKRVFYSFFYLHKKGFILLHVILLPTACCIYLPATLLGTFCYQVGLSFAFRTALILHRFIDWSNYMMESFLRDFDAYWYNTITQISQLHMHDANLPLYWIATGCLWSNQQLVGPVDPCFYFFLCQIWPNHLNVAPQIETWKQHFLQSCTILVSPCVVSVSCS